MSLLNVESASKVEVYKERRGRKVSVRPSQPKSMTSHRYEVAKRGEWRVTTKVEN